MTKIIKQQKVYPIGGSLYVLIPKVVREDAGITNDSSYNLTYDPKTKNMTIKLLKGDENGKESKTKA